MTSQCTKERDVTDLRALARKIDGHDGRVYGCLCNLCGAPMGQHVGWVCFDCAAYKRPYVIALRDWVAGRPWPLWLDEQS